MNKSSIWYRYSFVWVTLTFFLVSFLGHWVFAWYAYVNEQQEFNHPIEVQDYLIQTSRDTFENWQSEFLQIIWQVAGLAFLIYIGSPQSKEGDERKEEKLDLILKKVDPKNAEESIRGLDKKYPR
jgi:hypothetical protein